MTRQAQPVFREEQSLAMRRQRILLAIVPGAMLLLLIWQVILGHPWGKHPISNANVIGWTIFLWIVYLRLITVRLVTEVRTNELAVGMHGLWRERRIPWSDIKSAKVINYHPERDYGGYGIRTTRAGKAYIAHGTRGVRLELAQGRTVIIGSKLPEELAAAIHRSIQALTGLGRATMAADTEE